MADPKGIDKVQAPPEGGGGSFNRYVVIRVITDNSIPRDQLAAIVARVSNANKLVHYIF